MNSKKIAILLRGGISNTYGKLTLDEDMKSKNYVNFTCVKNSLYKHIVEKNIVCADALRYHYRFDGSHPYDDETKTQTQQKLINNFFDFA